MKKRLFPFLLLLLSVLPLQAQVYKDFNKTSKERLSELVNKTKKEVKHVKKSISDIFNDVIGKDTNDIIISGVRYMPVLKVDRYKGNAKELKLLCRQAFEHRYQKAKVLYVVIPQADWNEYAVKQNKKIISYKRELHCYVFAEDGDEGYLNVRYLFREMRQPGQEWIKSKSDWPLLDRADAISNVHYKQLVNMK